MLRRVSFSIVADIRRSVASWLGHGQDGRTHAWISTYSIVSSLIDRGANYHPDYGLPRSRRWDSRLLCSRGRKKANHGCPLHRTSVAYDPRAWEKTVCRSAGSRREQVSSMKATSSTGWKEQHELAHRSRRRYHRRNSQLTSMTWIFFMDRAWASRR